MRSKRNGLFKSREEKQHEKEEAKRRYEELLSRHSLFQSPSQSALDGFEMLKWRKKAGISRWRHYNNLEKQLGKSAWSNPMGKPLTKKELNTVLDAIYERASEALATRRRREFVEAISEITEWCQPGAVLEVDVEAGTVICKSY
jgi:hypothetical protein